MIYPKLNEVPKALLICERNEVRPQIGPKKEKKNKEEKINGKKDDKKSSIQVIPKPKPRESLDMYPIPNVISYAA